ncbi:gamma-butyrobetaine dioxygenase-like isoform X2 [Dysidea avara]|uniref:gamma-butyrobetaine dioxygenase-like isoform X2 n=1 Tax=Dysidea avara TaxID=196820 RepID=UPI0033243FAB
MLAGRLGRFAAPVSTVNKHYRRLVTTVPQVSSEGVHIKWDDDGERTTHYHNVWLRHNCHCPHCLADYNNQKTIQPAQLVNTRVTKATIEGDVVKLTWQQQGCDDGVHEGCIPLQWLKHHDYSDHQLNKKMKQAQPTPAPMGHLPEVDYDKVMDYDKVLWRWLWNLNEYGVCLVNNVPTVPGSIVKVTERIAHIQETIYGRTFQVVVQDKPINIAYTGEALSLHMDLIYYESPPGLQLLHCLRNDNSIIGGESLLLDTYPVLEELRNNYPEQFHILTRVPATFQKIHYKRESPVHIVSQVPHIVLGEHEEIVAVNWSPAFEGTLQVSPVDVEPYYQAYLLLAKLFSTSERLFQFRLLPGQLISFNNRRILHGRNSFYSEGEGVRHLEGAYVNIDEFNSRFHVLNRKFGSQPPKRVFNHSIL